MLCVKKLPRASHSQSGYGAMKKTPSEWKTRDLKAAAAANHFQHAFVDKTAHPTSLPFSFPHLRTLRNQSKIPCDLLQVLLLWVGLTAQLSINAHTLPTCGLHRQPLASVPRVPETPMTAVVTPQASHPRAAAQHRVVRITTPKKANPKAQEKPLPQLLPPLHGKCITM